jgi:excisionase family DNA binding protein
MNDNFEPNDTTEKKGQEYDTNELIKILTVQEVADLLRIHRSTVTRLAKSGEIRSYKLGNRRLFRDIDVVSFFENQVDREYVFGQEQ